MTRPTRRLVLVMSTQHASAESTSEPQQRDPHAVARDLTDLYDITVINNPEVCGTCHARIRDREELDTEETHDGLGTGNKPTETIVRVHSGDVGYDVERKDEYGALRDYHSRTCCAECGEFGGRTPSTTPSRRTMLARIDPLVETLERHGLAVDTETLRTAVRHLKSQPEYQARRDDIWRGATALAVRDAYR